VTKNLELGDAIKLLEAAEGRARGLATPVSIAIVDEGGHLVALHRMDGAKWLTPQIATGKAYTAAAFRTASGDMGTRFADVPLFSTSISVMSHGGFTPQAGGFPASRDDELLGAIGVSGGTSQQDIEIAKGALEDAGFS
jgi:uncharacterized protein GlcG (DUF336 family)